MGDTGKKLQDLRVCDLKEELEKRKLEVSGSKSILIERLVNALRDEGKDPVKYTFTINTKLNVAKRTGHIKSQQQQQPQEQQPEKNHELKIVVKKEPIVVKVEHAEDDQETDNNENATSNDNSNCNDEIDQVGDVDEEFIYVHDDDEVGDQADQNNMNKFNDYTERMNDNNSNASDLNHEDETNGENTNNDHEEGINLLIGEDEQQLLHDEAPDDKEKTIIKTAKDKAAATKDNKLEKAKEQRKSNRRDSKDKKKDDKSNEKKDESEQKLLASTKSGHKDEKE